MANVVIVLTSHNALGNSGKLTGFYFDEMATPYWALKDAGHAVTLASIQGGNPPFDPGSVKENPDERPAQVQRFLVDDAAMAELKNTPAVADLDPDAFDAVFLPGGHGTMFDFANNVALGALVGKVYDNDGTIGAICHGPAGLVGALRADGQPVVAGHKVSGFTNAEEVAVGMAETVPFLLEETLRAQGAAFEGTDNFKSHAVRDRQLVTGQNPASVAAVAELMLEALAARFTENAG
ncbi:MAG: glutamine amidotransferase [Gammaproteobacteria bacterium]|nr:MAG: glutamine amidotransferase [Gammaproteobacteria bacterium]PIE37224.1 MAG: glutamine amidotransferase [Gammaproteobacteria bacterium]